MTEEGVVIARLPHCLVWPYGAAYILTITIASINFALIPMQRGGIISHLL